MHRDQPRTGLRRRGGNCWQRLNLRDSANPGHHVPDVLVRIRIVTSEVKFQHVQQSCRRTAQLCQRDLIIRETVGDCCAAALGAMPCRGIRWSRVHCLTQPDSSIPISGAPVHVVTMFATPDEVRPVEFQSPVDMTISDAHDDRVSPRGSVHSHERPENVVGNESDTDSKEFEVEGSMASGDEEEVVPSLKFVMPNVERGAVQLTFQRLDSVNLRDEFRTRASVTKTVPGFLQGPFRQAMHVALEEICVGLRTMCARKKLLMLLPRMLLHRPARGGLIAKDNVSRRFEDFVHGRWSHLIHDFRICVEQSSKVATRKERRGGNRMMWKDVQRELKHWCKWENCQQGGRRWKARRWLQATNTRCANF